MQHMPDKEFDKLFRDQFADAEIEPSVNLWAGIEQQLAPKAKQRKLPIFWMAAASVVVVASAMLVFQKKEKIVLRGTESFAVVAPVKPTTQEVASVTEVAVANDNIQTTVATKAVYVKQAKSEEKNNNENFLASLQPSKENERLPIKQQEAKPIEVAKIEETVVNNPIVYAHVEVPQEVIDNSISEMATER
ncbi:MAG: hypothetical protein EOO87_19760, partial [Pedobacter sp.]